MASIETSFIIVPLGWRREVEENSVYYVSPDMKKLRNKSEVLRHLTSQGTCKCGLRCPFKLDQQFSFDPTIISLPDNSAIGVGETKTLCKIAHRVHQAKLQKSRPPGAKRSKLPFNPVGRKHGKKSPSPQGDEFRVQREENLTHSDVIEHLTHALKAAMASATNSDQSELRTDLRSLNWLANLTAKNQKEKEGKRREKEKQSESRLRKDEESDPDTMETGKDQPKAAISDTISDNDKTSDSNSGQARESSLVCLPKVSLSKSLHVSIPLTAMGEEEGVAMDVNQGEPESEGSAVEDTRGENLADGRNLSGSLTGNRGPFIATSPERLGGPGDARIEPCSVDIASKKQLETSPKSSTRDLELESSLDSECPSECRSPDWEARNVISEYGRMEIGNVESSTERGVSGVKMEEESEKQVDDGTAQSSVVNQGIDEDCEEMGKADIEVPENFSISPSVRDLLKPGGSRVTMATTNVVRMEAEEPSFIPSSLTTEDGNVPEPMEGNVSNPCRMENPTPVISPTIVTLFSTRATFTYPPTFIDQSVTTMASAPQLFKQPDTMPEPLPPLPTSDRQQSPSREPILATSDIRMSPPTEPILATIDIRMSPPTEPILATSDIRMSPPILATSDIRMSPPTEPILTTSDIRMSPPILATSDIRMSPPTEPILATSDIRMSPPTEPILATSDIRMSPPILATSPPREPLLPTSDGRQSPPMLATSSVLAEPASLTSSQQSPPGHPALETSSIETTPALSAIQHTASSLPTAVSSVSNLATSKYPTEVVASQIEDLTTNTTPQEIYETHSATPFSAPLEVSAAIPINVHQPVTTSVTPLIVPVPASRELHHQQDDDASATSQTHSSLPPTYSLDYPNTPDSHRSYKSPPPFWSSDFSPLKGSPSKDIPMRDFRLEIKPCTPRKRMASSENDSQRQGEGVREESKDSPMEEEVVLPKEPGERDLYGAIEVYPSFSRPQEVLQREPVRKRIEQSEKGIEEYQSSVGVPPDLIQTQLMERKIEQPGGHVPFSSHITGPEPVAVGPSKSSFDLDLEKSEEVLQLQQENFEAQFSKLAASIPLDLNVADVISMFQEPLDEGGEDMSLQKATNLLLEPEGVPSMSFGVPAMSLGVPATSLGVPSMTLGDPATSLSVPSTSLGVPATSLGVPSMTLGDPATSLGDPATTLGDPATSLGVPSTTLGDPATSLGDTATTLGDPATTLGDPAMSLSDPAMSLSDPATSLGDPATSLGVPSSPSVPSSPTSLGVPTSPTSLGVSSFEPQVLPDYKKDASPVTKPEPVDDTQEEGGIMTQMPEGEAQFVRLPLGELGGEEREGRFAAYQQRGEESVEKFVSEEIQQRVERDEEGEVGLGLQSAMEADEVIRYPAIQQRVERDEVVFGSQAEEREERVNEAVYPSVQQPVVDLNALLQAVIESDSDVCIPIVSEAKGRETGMDKPMVTTRPQEADTHLAEFDETSIDVAIESTAIPPKEASFEASCTIPSSTESTEASVIAVHGGDTTRSDGLLSGKSREHIIPVTAAVCSHTETMDVPFQDSQTEAPDVPFRDSQTEVLDVPFRDSQTEALGVAFQDPQTLVSQMLVSQVQVSESPIDDVQSLETPILIPQFQNSEIPMSQFQNPSPQDTSVHDNDVIQSTVPLLISHSDTSESPFQDTETPNLLSQHDHSESHDEVSDSLPLSTEERAELISGDGRAVSETITDDARAVSETITDDARAVSETITDDDARATSETITDDARATSETITDDARAVSEMITGDARAVSETITEDARAVSETITGDARATSETIIDDARATSETDARAVSETITDDDARATSETITDDARAVSETITGDARAVSETITEDARAVSETITGDARATSETITDDARAMSETITGEERAMSETITEERAMSETITEERAMSETITEERAMSETITGDERAMSETITEERAMSETITGDERAMSETITEERAMSETITEERAMSETITGDERAMFETITGDERAMSETVTEERAMSETITEERAMFETITGDERAMSETVSAEESSPMKFLQDDSHQEEGEYDKDDKQELVEEFVMLESCTEEDLGLLCSESLISSCASSLKEEVVNVFTGSGEVDIEQSEGQSSEGTQDIALHHPRKQKQISIKRRKSSTEVPTSPPSEIAIEPSNVPTSDSVAKHEVVLSEKLASSEGMELSSDSPLTLQGMPLVNIVAGDGRLAEGELDGDGARVVTTRTRHHTKKRKYQSRKKRRKRSRSSSAPLVTEPAATRDGPSPLATTKDEDTTLLATEPADLSPFVTDPTSYTDTTQQPPELPTSNKDTPHKHVVPTRTSEMDIDQDDDKMNDSQTIADDENDVPCGDKDVRTSEVPKGTPEEGNLEEALEGNLEVTNESRGVSEHVGIDQKGTTQGVSEDVGIDQKGTTQGVSEDVGIDQKGTTQGVSEHVGIEERVTPSQHSLVEEREVEKISSSTRSKSRKKSKLISRPSPMEVVSEENRSSHPPESHAREKGPSESHMEASMHTPLQPDPRKYISSECMTPDQHSPESEASTASGKTQGQKRRRSTDSTKSPTAKKLKVSIPVKCVNLTLHTVIECYSTSSFSEGDVIWAKAQQLPAWPGRIISHKERKKDKLKPAPEGQHWVEWFGDGTVSLVEAESIKPLSEGIKQRRGLSTKKRKPVKQLPKQLDDAINKALRAHRKLLKARRKAQEM